MLRLLGCFLPGHAGPKDRQLFDASSLSEQGPTGTALQDSKHEDLRATRVQQLCAGVSGSAIGRPQDSIEPLSHLISAGPHLVPRSLTAGTEAGSAPSPRTQQRNTADEQARQRNHALHREQSTAKGVKLPAGLSPQGGLDTGATGGSTNVGPGRSCPSTSPASRDSPFRQHGGELQGQNDGTSPQRHLGSAEACYMLVMGSGTVTPGGGAGLPGALVAPKESLLKGTGPAVAQPDAFRVLWASPGALAAMGRPALRHAASVTLPDDSAAAQWQLHLQQAAGALALVLDANPELHARLQSYCAAPGVQEQHHRGFKAELPGGQACDVSMSSSPSAMHTTAPAHLCFRVMPMQLPLNLESTHTSTASPQSCSPLLLLEISQWPHHATNADESQQQQQQLLDSLMLRGVPAIVTLCELDGTVLHQNAASRAHLGDLLAPGVPDTRQAHGGSIVGGADAFNLLSVLFELEPAKRDDLLAALSAGPDAAWQGIVQVPPKMQFARSPRPTVTYTKPLPPPQQQAQHDNAAGAGAPLDAPPSHHNSAAWQTNSGIVRQPSGTGTAGFATAAAGHAIDVAATAEALAASEATSPSAAAAAAAAGGRVSGGAHAAAAAVDIGQVGLPWQLTGGSTCASFAGTASVVSTSTNPRSSMETCYQQLITSHQQRRGSGGFAYSFVPPPAVRISCDQAHTIDSSTLPAATAMRVSGAAVPAAQQPGISPGSAGGMAATPLPTPNSPQPNTPLARLHSALATSAFADLLQPLPAGFGDSQARRLSRTNSDATAAAAAAGLLLASSAPQPPAPVSAAAAGTSSPRFYDRRYSLEVQQLQLQQPGRQKPPLRASPSAHWGSGASTGGCTCGGAAPAHGPTSPTDTSAAAAAAAGTPCSYCRQIQCRDAASRFFAARVRGATPYQSCPLGGGNAAVTTSMGPATGAAPASGWQFERRRPHASFSRGSLELGPSGPRPSRAMTFISSQLMAAATAPWPAALQTAGSSNRSTSSGAAGASAGPIANVVNYGRLGGSSTAPGCIPVPSHAGVSTSSSNHNNAPGSPSAKLLLSHCSGLFLPYILESEGGGEASSDATTPVPAALRRTHTAMGAAAADGSAGRGGRGGSGEDAVGGGSPKAKRGGDEHDEDAEAFALFKQLSGVDGTQCSRPPGVQAPVVPRSAAMSMQSSSSASSAVVAAAAAAAGAAAAAAAAAALRCNPTSPAADSLDIARSPSELVVGGGSRGAGGGGAGEGAFAPAASAAAAPAPTTSGTGAQSRMPCWHEVRASRLYDGALGREVVLLVQTDVSTRVLVERRLAAMLEAEHQLLEGIFPKHVLQHAVAAAASALERGEGGGAASGCEQQAQLRELQQGCPEAAPLLTAGSLQSVLPQLRGAQQLATRHTAVTVLFADVVGFTPMCAEVAPEAVMAFLNDMFSRFDALLDIYGVYKVETIGDCYMVAGGLMRRDSVGTMEVRDGDEDALHAVKVVSFAKAMLREAAGLKLPTGQPVRIRVGIHSGPVTSGVVGMRMPRFCLFGDTVNTASRMESTCSPNCIHASAATRDLVPEEPWQRLGSMEVKGKGAMHTFLLRAAADAAQQQALPLRIDGTSVPGRPSSGGTGTSCTASVFRSSPLPTVLTDTPQRHHMQPGWGPHGPTTVSASDSRVQRLMARGAAVAAPRLHTGGDTCV